MSVAEFDENFVKGMTAQAFAGTPLFNRTFDEGMALVEQAARYLDGRGKEEARNLPRKSAMLYASESLRVTTRLMQAASWLLVQRAVHEGDMPASDANDDRYRLGSKEICFGGRSDEIAGLPKALQDLLVRSESLYRRIARLEEVLLNARPATGMRTQFERLEQAFGG
jgi:regulator of CtrA degradation